jgi:hypothetical protein
LDLRNPSQVASAEGAEMKKLPGGVSALRVSFPATSRSEYENATVIVHLVSAPTSATTGR